jgi:hypothetical protein
MIIEYGINKERVLKKSALIILERPWGYEDRDQNVVSVLPYFQGLEKLDGEFDLYHSNFYEATSFRMALDELTKLDYEQYFVYIACHGSGLRLGKMNLTTVLGEINEKANTRNIKGVILGACLVGNNAAHMEVYTESSSINWKIGYRCSVDWLDGTLLDLKFFYHLMALSEEQLFQKKEILDAIKSALKIYNPASSIGEDQKSDVMLLSDSLTVVIQAKGQGNRAKDYSEPLFTA